MRLPHLTRSKTANDCCESVASVRGCAGNCAAGSRTSPTNPGAFEIIVRPFLNVNAGRTQVSTNGGALPSLGAERPRVVLSGFERSADVRARSAFGEQHPCARKTRRRAGAVALRLRVRRRPRWSIPDDQGTGAVRLREAARKRGSQLGRGADKARAPRQ